MKTSGNSTDKSKLCAEKLKAGHVQGMLATLQFRNLLLPVCCLKT